MPSFAHPSPLVSRPKQPPINSNGGMPATKAPTEPWVGTGTTKSSVEPQASDIFIAVMGVTGAGKSTFISLVADKPVRIGNDLKSCTQEVSVYRCRHSQGVNIWLVDTPGFDDTDRSDTDVLREIATWLTKSFSNAVKLNGMIYLHRITDHRMTGSAKKNLFMFKKLCGKDALKHVILATTMWERVAPDEGEQREKQLLNTSEFWGEMRTLGAQVERHHNTVASAKRLINIHASKAPGEQKTILTIQNEMVTLQKPLDETDAGREVESALVKEREKWQKELAETQQMMKEAIAEKDEESARLLQEAQDKMKEQLAAAKRAQDELKVDMEKMYNDKVSAVQKKLDEQEKEKNDYNQKVSDLQNRLAQQEKEKDNYNQKVTDLQRKVDQQATVSALKRKLEQEETQRNDYSQKVSALQKKLEQEEKEKNDAKARISALEQDQKFRCHSKILPDITKFTTMTLSFSGSYYYFCGPKRDHYDVPSSYCKAKAFLEGSDEYVRIGSNGSCYRHYHKNGECWTWTSDNFESEYPDLEGYLKQYRQYGCPKNVSLGNDGHYFAHTEWGRSWSVPSDIATAAGDMSKVVQVWFGKDDAYIISMSNGRYIWDLRGHYSKLHDKLKSTKGLDIRAAALNLEAPECWALVLRNGTVMWCTGGSSDPGNFDNFLLENSV
ncbi:hypothetical protein BDV38DRAFT_281527 [Aspergillus pseudotamarii]|uniref:G domain-containing protein n=1 Tax=Aspergillus pseudotamarii TaxID=132259 RepID=A0A5N6SYI5_ASPPS|nr:uncharacterized protein BDV38DRAFT_281527 [Aspergillus pseudotamarii]KAE8138967.1 hypothetical protein BDV38DRAFT_281527 [Aspergillus pseudotamarii]